MCGQQQIVELTLSSPFCYLLSVFSVSRYHLQALRHLYVLAAEPRLLVPVDVDTNMPCYALLEVTYKVILSSFHLFVILLPLIHLCRSKYFKNVVL